ncbi:MAG: apolipoprotein N-acyltransferase [Armatimonadota bacterium]|nr:apolipoprotein N-acyltransferase [Armatimonadota bacterium]
MAGGPWPVEERAAAALVPRHAESAVGLRFPRVAAGALSGVLLALAFPTPGWAALAWIALVPLLVALDGLTPTQAFVPSFVFGLAFHALVFSWMAVFGVPAYAVVVCTVALFFGLFGVLARAATAGRRALGWLIGIPACWVAVEWVRTLGTASFPWGLVGYSQWQNLPVLQVASVGGVFAVSALVVFVNTGMAVAVRTRAWLPAAGALVVLAAVWAWGSARLEPVDAGILRVAAIQHNIAQREKFLPDLVERNRDVLLALTRQAVAFGAQLVVWPEHVWPEELVRSGQVPPEVERSAPADGAVVATGHIEGRRNSAVVVTREGMAGRYDKVRLVPMGEWWAEPGPGFIPVPAPQGPAGILICYESVYPSATRELVRRGARYLVHTTEEGWFGPSAGPLQHLGFTVFRAVESGRDAVRAASTGVTAIIDRHGRILASLPRFERAWLPGAITPRDGSTPYARFGDAWVWIVCAALVGTVLPGVLRELPPRSLVVLVAPAVSWLAVGALTWVSPWPDVAPMVAVLLTVAAVLPDARGLGLAGGRPVVGVVVATGAVVVAVWLIRVGYAAHGIPLPDGLPGAATVALSALAGAGEEIWLRGAVPHVLARWPLAAFGVSVAGSLVLHGAAAGEVAAWHVVTAALFFGVRRLTGSVLGPVVARGVGDAALRTLLGL